MDLLQAQTEHLVRLAAWSVAWLLLSLPALARRPGGAVRPFWLTTAAWCLVNLAIVAYAAANPTGEADRLVRLLIGSQVFNVACVATGVVLARHRAPLPKGVGSAVLVQALALLILDGVLLLQLSRP